MIIRVENWVHRTVNKADHQIATAIFLLAIAQSSIEPMTLGRSRKGILDAQRKENAADLGAGKPSSSVCQNIANPLQVGVLKFIYPSHLSSSLALTDADLRLRIHALGWVGRFRDFIGRFSVDS
jgi:hypothetical protein